MKTIEEAITALKEINEILKETNFEMIKLNKQAKGITKYVIYNTASDCYCIVDRFGIVYARLTDATLFNTEEDAKLNLKSFILDIDINEFIIKKISIKEVEE